MENNEYIRSHLKGTEYSGEAAALYRHETKQSKQGENYEVTTYLANGSIIGECYTKRDDGATIESKITIRVFANGKYLGEYEVPQQDFDTKLMQYLPLEFRPAVGGNSKAYISDSIRAQAANMIQLIIFQHTGWRVIDGDVAFLHNDGAIGKDGITVELNGRLSRYKFTEETHESRWKSFFDFLNVAPHSVTYPLLAISALSPLNEFLRKAGCEPSFLLFLLGKTGTKKSTLAALTLCFFGEFDNKSLPGSSKDTSNSLEKMGFLSKDVLTVIDDFHPSMNRNDVSRMEQTAQAVCRMYGDRTGKNRMNADGSLRVNYPVRGNAILTGEDVPSVGQSGEARFLSVELTPEDVDIDVLTAVQTSSIHLNECMRDYIIWLIPLFDKLSETLKSRFIELRSNAQDGGHGRIAEAIAHLQVAIEMWTLFMKSTNIISESEAEAIRGESWSILGELAKKQNKSISEEKPSTLFLSALHEMLSTRRVKLVPTNTSVLSDDCIGWQDENYAYLLMETAYNAVCKFYRDRDKSFPLSKRLLLKHLAAEKLIVPSEDNTKQKKLGGKNRRVVWLYSDALEENNNMEENK